MSNSSACRWAYSIAVVVLPTPPIPFTACTAARPPAVSAARSSASSVVPAGERRQPAPGWSTPDPTGTSADRGAGQRGQRLQQRGLQLRRRVTVAVVTPLRQPLPERLLPRPVLQIPEHRRRALGVLAEQEHQPGHAQLRRRLVLQLGVGHLRPVPHRRPVPEPGDQHVHIRRRHRLPAHLRRARPARRSTPCPSPRPRPGPPPTPPPRRTTAPPGTAATPTCETGTPAAAARTPA